MAGDPGSLVPGIVHQTCRAAFCSHSGLQAHSCSITLLATQKATGRGRAPAYRPTAPEGTPSPYLAGGHG